jgi:hypothetical protein
MPEFFLGMISLKLFFLCETLCYNMNDYSTEFHRGKWRFTEESGLRETNIK